MKIFPGDNERTITVAIISFCVGAVLIMVGGVGDELSEVLLPAVTTLAAAFLGAKYAFSLQNRREENDLTEKRIEAGNRAIFKIVSIYHQFGNFRDQFINPFRDHPFRYIAILPEIGMREIPEFDFDSLGFLFKSKNPNILMEIYQLQSGVQSNFDLIKIRSDLHRGLVQDSINEFGRKNNGHVDMSKISEILGDKLYTTLVRSTDDMIEFTDNILSDADRLIHELRKILKALFPGHIIIGFEKLNKASQQDSK
jgi:hypothetical protein